MSLYFDSFSDLSPVWRDLTCDLIMLIIDHTNDNTTLKSWSCVNRLLGLRANRRLWNTLSLTFPRGLGAPAIHREGLDALVRACGRVILKITHHPLCEPMPLIKNLEVTIVNDSRMHRSSLHRAQAMDCEFAVEELLGSLENIRGLSISGPIHESDFERFLSMGALERMHIRVPPPIRNLGEIGCLQAGSDNPRTFRSQAAYSGSSNIEYPLSLAFLEDYQNLRVLSVHGLLLSEAHSLAFVVRTLQLTELDVFAAGQTNSQGLSPLGIFLKALVMDCIHLDVPLPRLGFPASLTKLMLNEDDETRCDRVKTGSSCANSV